MLTWLQGGPEEVAFLMMGMLSGRVCPLCKGPHTLSNCPRWRVNYKG